jgi:hypothetical protein
MQTNERTNKGRHMNTIVAEIHSAFSIAEEELLQEAQAILDRAKSDEAVEYADRLARMGFTGSKPVRLLSKEEQAKAEELLFYKTRYERIAPQYRFITEEKLLSICKKYGLVVGASERYRGDIPITNQEDIISFKILDQSFLEVSDESYRDAVHITKLGERMHPKDMGTDHIENTIDYYRRRGSAGFVGLDTEIVSSIRAMVTELHLRGESKSANYHKMLWIDRSNLSRKLVERIFTPIKTTYFYVAADVDSFDTKGTDLKNNILVEQNNNKELAEAIKAELFREYDPIVLAKVQGGYLIVTAWGLEASDPDVVEPTRN